MHLFNGVESSPTSRQIIGDVNKSAVKSPRPVSTRRPSRPKREESEVAVGHVAVLGAEQKARHDGELRMTVYDNCRTDNTSTVSYRQTQTKKNIRRHLYAKYVDEA